MAPSSRLSGSPAGTTKRSFGERARESATFFHAGVSSPPSGSAPGRRLDHAGRQCCRLLSLLGVIPATEQRPFLLRYFAESDMSNPPPNQITAQSQNVGTGGSPPALAAYLVA
uniref:Uncharacterized protein n=1 Tax=Coccidioides posadasii RMSCC 3488 TaxID=454284 RepID=A0A0J6FKC5_COCPO|nr:hypothetical protein CPAG_06193 [Coccidioides posadasii RMSCC 3488]